MIAMAAPRPGQLEHPATLAVRGVSKRFGVVQALEGVSLAVRPGEILALVGENGALKRYGTGARGEFDRRRV